MKIGIFDSGVGGLFVLREIVKTLPGYDYIYLGDTKRVPYGNRSPAVIYSFTRQAVDFLFKNDCKLVILACNTASAQALRMIQREYLPKHYPDRRVLGVIIPTVEVIVEGDRVSRVGVLATKATVDSKSFLKEFKKRNPKLKVYQKAAPMLVPLIESGGLKFIEPFLKDYLAPFQKARVQKLILGCTHYSAIAGKIQKQCAGKIEVLPQDKIVADKLAAYLKAHPEIEKTLTKNRKREFLFTDLTSSVKQIGKKWFGKSIRPKLANL